MIMASAEMLSVLEKLCGGATVVHLRNCFRIYLGDVFVEGVPLPPQGLINGAYWTRDGGTEEIVINKAYYALYDEIGFQCILVECGR